MYAFVSYIQIFMNTVIFLTIWNLCSISCFMLVMFCMHGRKKNIFSDFEAKFIINWTKKLYANFLSCYLKTKIQAATTSTSDFFFCSLCPKPLTNWILFFQLHNIYLVLCIVFQTLVTWRHSTFSKYFFINSFLKSLLILQILFIFSNSTSSRIL
jgi:hypothetical protein